MPKMTPPIKDLLPRLTPILKNRHEKVQENCSVAASFFVSFRSETTPKICGLIAETL